MKNKTILSGIGIIIFFILTAIDKFFLSIPDILYITIGLISITLIIIGFLSDKRKIPSKKRNKNILIALIITIIISIIYINPLYVYRNIKVKQNFENIVKKEKINSKELIPFKYDKAYIIMPYTDKESIEKQLNIKSRYIKDNSINDNTKELIIIKNNQVISSTYISSKINISPISDDNSITNKEDTYYYIYKENNNYNLIETPNNKKETYHNISFTIPGIWNREDIEGERMYYLDIIDDTSNLTITKVEDFNYKKYKKNNKYEKEQELTINNRVVNYLEITKDNNHKEIEYIVTINKETYIFKLYTNNKLLTKYQNELKEVINTIKEVKGEV